MNNYHLRYLKTGLESMIVSEDAYQGQHPSEALKSILGYSNKALLHLLQNHSYRFLPGIELPPPRYSDGIKTIVHR